MRARGARLLLVLGAIAGPAMLAACNSILGNQAGHLGGDADAGDASVEGGRGDSAEQPDAPYPDVSADVRTDVARDAPGAADAHDASVDVDAGWTPLALGPALTLWLDGDQGITPVTCGSATCVSAWADQSGNGNDAIWNSGTATAPLAEPALYSGHGAVRFDGNSTSLTVADAPSFAIASGFSIVGVGAQPHAFHIAGFYSKTQIGNPYEGVGLWGSYTTNFQDGTGAVQVDINQYVVTPAGGFDDSKLHVFAAMFDGANLSLSVDEGVPVSRAVSVTPGLGAPGVPGFVGGNPGGGQTFNGDIVEIILVGRILQTTEWSMLYAYLAAKYGVH